MSAGSVSVQGRKTGAAAETVQKQQKQHTENNMAQQQQKMCSKLSAVVASAYFQQKTKICRSQSEI
jgi:hypothetical protein